MMFLKWKEENKMEEKGKVYEQENKLDKYNFMDLREEANVDFNMFRLKVLAKQIKKGKTSSKLYPNYNLS